MTETVSLGLRIKSFPLETRNPAAPFTVHVKLSSNIMGAGYCYHCHLHLSFVVHILSFYIPVPITHSLCHTHSESFTCHSGKLRPHSTIHCLSFILCHSLVKHIISHCHYFPLQISQFSPNLSPMPEGALFAS